MFTLADGHNFEILMITNDIYIYIYNSNYWIDVFRNWYYRNKIFRTKIAFTFVLF